jgi:hypothetical protein
LKTLAALTVAIFWALAWEAQEQSAIKVMRGTMRESFIGDPFTVY